MSRRGNAQPRAVKLGPLARCPPQDILTKEKDLTLLLSLNRNHTLQVDSAGRHHDQLQFPFFSPHSTTSIHSLTANGNCNFRKHFFISFFLDAN